MSDILARIFSSALALVEVLHNSDAHKHFFPSWELDKHTSKGSPPVYMFMQSRMTVPSGLSILEQTHSFISETDLDTSCGCCLRRKRLRSMQSSTVISFSSPTKHLKLESKRSEITLTCSSGTDVYVISFILSQSALDWGKSSKEKLLVRWRQHSPGTCFLLRVTQQVLVSNKKSIFTPQKDEKLVNLCLHHG